MKHLAWILVLLASVCILLSPGSQAQVVSQDFEKDPLNPAFAGGGPGTWDETVLAPMVLYNPDSARYEMWYTGWLGGRANGIGFAVSTDGLTWERISTEPVLQPTPGAWDSLVALGGWVIRENGQYKMWYTGGSSTLSNGFPHHIGYAVSPDGIQWTKHAGPVLSPGTQTWEASSVAYCCVIPGGNGYTMFYTGETSANARIGRAFSADGISWERDTSNNPVLTGGPSGSWDRNAYLPRVVRDNDHLDMFYTAEPVPRGGASKIGGAKSTDEGRTWVKDTLNPLLDLGASGEWDMNAVELGSVLLEGGMFQMWFDGEKYLPLFGARVGTSWARSTAVLEEWPVPTGFVLDQNYPNPFNPVTKIRFTIVDRRLTIVSVHDLLGQEVATLVNEVKDPGTYEVVFDASGLASGVYLYRLTAGDYVQARRLILIR